MSDTPPLIRTPRVVTRSGFTEGSQVCYLGHRPCRTVVVGVSGSVTITRCPVCGTRWVGHGGMWRRLS